jgi:hypothetical protein
MSRANARPRIETDAGPEIQCTQCKEFWPEDDEFYFIDKIKGPHSWCKACYRDAPSVAVKRQRAREKIAARRAATQGVTA